ncbi:MAG: phage tail protein [Dehalococcoidia bacterium]
MTLQPFRDSRTPVLADAPPGYLFLNTGAGWPSLHDDWVEGLAQTPEGALELLRVPGDFAVVGPAAGVETGLLPSGGIAIDADGDIYLSDPAGHRVWRVPCAGQPYPLACLHGPGAAVGALDHPGGIAVSPDGRLYIADTANHRVQVVDLRSGQVRAIWGQPGSLAVPTASAEAGRFNSPRGIAIDHAGNVYIADTGNARIQRFDAFGRVDRAFATAFAAQFPVLAQPSVVALLPASDVERLLVIDAASGVLSAYTTGGALDVEESARWAGLGPITAVAADGEALYTGDATGAVRVHGRDGRLRGEVRPFARRDDGADTISALALDCHGRLFARQAGGTTLSMAPAAAFVRCGAFMLGPVQPADGPVRWQSVALDAAAGGASTHIQVFTLSSNTLDGTAPATTPAAPVSCAGPAASTSEEPGPETLVPLDTWRAAPGDTLDFLALNEPGTYLWIAALIQGDGSASPLIQQVRVDFNRRSWVADLPAVYQRSAPELGFADRMMLLFESILSDSSDAMDEMARLFDPAAAPDDGRPSSWLDWLAGWLALELPEDWSQERRRRAVAEAFRAHGRRGTVESLRALIELSTSARVHISEPARFASIWSLGETSVLGADTMLAAAHAEGAVLGATATLGQSHLIGEEDFGAPLFEDLAHRFCVSVYDVDMADDRTAAYIRDVIEREKPAHTVYDLCTTGALMRVGFQAQVGIDTIVAGLAGEFMPGGPALLGLGSVLPGLPRGSAPAIGRSTTLGGVLTIA